MGKEAMDVDYVSEESNDLLRGLNEVELKRFLKTAARSFFKQYGLISHQLNSYNEFIKNGIQEVFDSVGEIIVKPLHDSSQYSDGEWRSASVKFGEVTFEQPKFYGGEKFPTDDGDCFVDMLPRHARLQNMTYAARMQVQVNFKDYGVSTTYTPVGESESARAKNGFVVADAKWNRLAWDSLLAQGNLHKYC